MIDQVTVAAVSVDSACGRWQENVERMDSWAARAVGEGVRLVLFPELSLTGFHSQSSHGRTRTLAARGVGRSTPCCSTARRSRGRRRSPRSRQSTTCCSRPGCSKDAGNLLYNTQVLVGPDGLLGHWRKMHIPMFEAPFYNGGGVPEVVETPLRSHWREHLLRRLHARVDHDFWPPLTSRSCCSPSPPIRRPARRRAGAPGPRTR